MSKTTWKCVAGSIVVASRDGIEVDAMVYTRASHANVRLLQKNLKWAIWMAGIKLDSYVRDAKRAANK